MCRLTGVVRQLISASAEVKTSRAMKENMVLRSELRRVLETLEAPPTNGGAVFWRTKMPTSTPVTSRRSSVAISSL
jgi:hypothetical protein